MPLGSTPPARPARGGPRRAAALAGVGYTGADKGIHTPFRPHPDIALPLAPDTRAYNRLLRGVRAIDERTAAELKQHWRALRYTKACPSRVGAITQAGPSKSLKMAPCNTAASPPPHGAKTRRHTSGIFSSFPDNPASGR